MNMSEALRIAVDGRSAPLDVGIVNQKKVHISFTCMHARSAWTQQQVITADNMWIICSFAAWIILQLPSAN